MTSGLPRAVRLPVKSAMMLLVVCAMVLRLSKSGRKTTMAVLKKSQMMPTTIQPVRNWVLVKETFVGFGGC